jgi:hypothetical protein
MPRTWSLPMHALAWLCLAACQSPDGSSAATGKTGKTEGASPTKPAPETTPAEPTPPEGFSEPPGDAVPGPAPAWFSPDAFEHVAILRQDVAGTRIPSGQTSAMIVLELPAATTPEQCIERARAKLAETVKDPPIASTMPQGHLSLRGKGDNYEYTVVCGIAKDKPTMFLSYSQ